MLKIQTSISLRKLVRTTTCFLATITLLLSLGGCTKDELATSGKIMFWTDYSSNGVITFYVDGSNKGSISKYWAGSSSPSCDQSGFLTVSLPVGTHTFTASSSAGYTWGPTSFTIRKDECTSGYVY